MSLEKRYEESLDRLPSFIKRKGKINNDRNWSFRSDCASGIYYALKGTNQSGFSDVEKYIKPIVGLNEEVDTIVAKQFLCALQRNEVSVAIFNSSQYRSDNNISDEFADKMNSCLMKFVLDKIQEAKDSLDTQEKVYQKALVRNQKMIDAGKKPAEIEKPRANLGDVGFQELNMLFHTSYFQQNFVKNLKERNLDEAFFKTEAELYVGYGDRNLISGNMAHCLFMKSMISPGRLYVEKYGLENKDSYYKRNSGVEFFKVQEKVSNLNDELFSLPTFGKALDEENLRWGSFVFLFEVSEMMTSNEKSNEKKLGKSYYSSSERTNIKDFLYEFSGVFLNVGEKNNIVSSTQELNGWFNTVTPHMWRHALRDAENLGSEHLRKYKLNYLVEFAGVDHFAEIRSPSPFALKSVTKEKGEVEANLAQLLKSRTYGVREFTSSLKEANIKNFYGGLLSIKKMKDDDWDNHPKYDKMMELYRATNSKRQFVASPASLTQHTVDRKIKEALSKTSDGGNDVDFPLDSSSFKL